MESMTAVYPVVWYGFKFKEPVTDIQDSSEISSDVAVAVEDPFDLFEIASGVYLQAIADLCGDTIGVGMKLFIGDAETVPLDFTAIMSLLKKVQEPVMNFFETVGLPKPELYMGCEDGGVVGGEDEHEDGGAL